MASVQRWPLLVGLLSMTACGLFGGGNGGGSSDPGLGDLPEVSGPEGTLRFAAAASSNAPIYANRLAVADFNGDGARDLALGSDSGRFGLVFGRSDGGYMAGGADNTGPLRAIATADFDGNGRADVALGGSSVGIYLGQGNGGFQPLQTLPYDTVALLARDFNGDGRWDLAIAHAGGGTLPGTFTVLVFGSNQPQDFMIAQPTALAAGDFNGDGRLDLAVGSSAQATRRVSIFLGSASGSFTAGQTYMLGAGELRSIAVGDFEGTSALDLAVPGERGFVTVLVGQGSGSFTTGGSYSANTNNGAVLSLVAADFNGGGRRDLAALGVPLSGPASLTVLVRRPEGGFQAPVPLGDQDTAKISPTALAAVDANRDRKADLVVTAGNQVTVYLNTSQ